MKFRLISWAGCFLAGCLFLLSASIVSAEDSPTPENQLPKENEHTNETSYDAFFSLYQPYLENISAYKPMYFLVGANPEKSAFQFSFKYQFLDIDDPLAQKNAWISRLFFAYTQTSFWNLASKSKPFEDTSYKPEIFFLSSNLRERDSLFAGLFFQTGAQHESNGQSGMLSRSTNYLYLKPLMIFYQKSSGYGLQVAPKFWIYVLNDEETNGDFDKYRGFMDLQLKFGKADSVVIDTHFWTAAKGSSFQCDLTYPINRHFDTNLNLYLHAQYSYRLSERLLAYQERTEAFRLGVSIVR